MRRRFLALAAVMGVLAGCSGPGHHSSAPSTSLSPQTAASPNPDVIPPVITPAYVNAVFAVLNHINGDATRQLVASNRLTENARADLRSIYNDPLYKQEIKIADQSLAGGVGTLRQPPGDIVTTVTSLISGTSTCIFVATKSDFTAVLVNPTAPVPSEYWEMRPKQEGDDPGHLNPTPWALSFNADYLTPTTIPNQCASS